MEIKRKIDELPEKPRPKELQVLCLGMSRTGTMSLWKALQKLGYKSYHMYECCTTDGAIGLDYWEEAIQAKYHGKGKPFEKKDFDKFLGEYEAISDIPSIFFVDEFVTNYPNAKIIITSRDVESWIKSMENVFYATISWKSINLFRRLDKEFWAKYVPFLERSLDFWTNGDRYNRDALRQGFHNHYKHVREISPKERTLEFNLRDGWAPLCEFLGKEIPDEPFPFVNEAPDTAKMHTGAMIYTVFQKGMKWTVRISPLAVAAVAAWWYLKSK
ncbi:P-loop containing nucleoside triphosphate hydrolase protein [Clohesyomyces aquaticus]|uniref:p-loop containing nucleoside triphosphate hydrolase protein n=1 Tax=Clohesyomyces aquaticus TaxID=1231657 RepID=A0A1Y1ZEA8_9PLEO|nr:P-loop containing nucleoside triphosphate hydrolase protein [Clohesyomyces aquaticus]